MAGVAASNPYCPQTKVAKQVMGLFKGALEIEKELEVFEEETLRMQQELTNNSGPNTNASPPSGIGHLGVSVTTSNVSVFLVMAHIFYLADI